MERRQFLIGTAGAAADENLNAPLGAAGRTASIGIQVGAVSFVHEGIENALDLLRERAASDNRSWRRRPTS
jgi:hypothetical protein